MGYPRITAACLVALALAGPSRTVAGDMPMAPDPKAAIGDGAWEALTRQVAAPRPAVPGPVRDAQAREVAEGLSLLRMARERSAPPPRVDAGAIGKVVQRVPLGGVAKGDLRDVPGSGLEVMVGRPVPSGPRPGDTCSLQRGGNVEVMGEDPEMGTLVRYVSPASPGRSEGVPCASGTMAFVEAAALRDWPPKGDVEAQDKAMSDRVARAADRILGAAR